MYAVGLALWGSFSRSTWEVSHRLRYNTASWPHALGVLSSCNRLPQPRLGVCLGFGVTPCRDGGGWATALTSVTPVYCALYLAQFIASLSGSWWLVLPVCVQRVRWGHSEVCCIQLVVHLCPWSCHRGWYKVKLHDLLCSCWACK